MGATCKRSEMYAGFKDQNSPVQNATACQSEHYKRQKQLMSPSASRHQKGIELGPKHSPYGPREVHVLHHIHDYQIDEVPPVTEKLL